MRLTYRQVSSRAEIPANGALIHFWSENGRIRADVETGEDESREPTDPDLALFRVNLAVNQRELSGPYVWLDDPALWQDEWGRLAPY